MSSSVLRPPERKEIIQILRDLCSGQLSRSDAARWAAKWITLDFPPDMPQELWDALEKLSGVDMPSTDRRFLFSLDDVHSWLLEMLDAPDDSGEK